MIRALIFDCFGVLTTDGWLVFKDRYLAGDEIKLQQGIDLNHQADRGIISQGTFVKEIAALANVSEQEALSVVNRHVCNDRLFEAIRAQWKPRFKIGLLSNASSDYTDELFTPEQNALFDATTFSFELGVIKPHPAMYENIASKLEVAPEECLFIDDRMGFVAGAQEVGMEAILFEDTDQTIQAITEKVAGNAGTA